MSEKMKKKPEIKNLFHETFAQAEDDSGDIKMIPVKDIVVKAPFSNVFRFDQERGDEIASLIKKEGYWAGEAVILWKNKSGELILIDGRHRHYGAEKAGVEKIPAVFREFNDADDAQDFALRYQCKLRRNIDPSEVLYSLLNNNILNSKKIKNKKNYVSETYNIGERTAQYIINIVNNGSQEHFDRINNGEAPASVDADLPKGDMAKKVSETKKKKSEEKKKASGEKEGKSPVVDRRPDGLDSEDRAESRAWDKLDEEAEGDSPKGGYKMDIDENIDIPEIPEPEDSPEEDTPDAHQGGAELSPENDVFSDEDRSVISNFMLWPSGEWDMSDKKKIREVLDRVSSFLGEIE